MDKKSIESLDDLSKLLGTQVHNKQGSIVIYVDGIPKISNSNDIVGNSLQEWLPAWFSDNGLNLTPNKHTQAFPDFMAHFKNEDIPMDIKCWNFNSQPAFDIANFDSFYRTTYSEPEKITAKYLVIGYKPNKHGFTIEYVALKNLWELLGETATKPMNLQVKQGKPYAIRPINFRKPEKAFNDVEKMLDAIKKTRDKYPNNDPNNEITYTSDDWYEKVSSHLKSIGILQ